MAGVLKYWRESATLLLTSKRLPPLPLHSHSTPSLLSKVLKTNPQEHKISDEEESLRLLMMKRSSQSRFMPNNYVFPGGMLDDADFSKGWKKLLRLTEETNHFFTKGKEGAFIFSRQRDNEFKSISAEVALRIAAIRETFEESGVLLARPINEVTEILSTCKNHPLECRVHNTSDDKSITKWRKKIMEDPNQFLNMCEEIGVAPDIWSLYEWAIWMTPLHLRSRRYDTAFFIGCIEEAPKISIDTGEMQMGLVSINKSSSALSNAHHVSCQAPPFSSVFGSL